MFRFVISNVIHEITNKCNSLTFSRESLYSVFSVHVGFHLFGISCITLLTTKVVLVVMSFVFRSWLHFEVSWHYYCLIRNTHWQIEYLIELALGLEDFHASTTITSQVTRSPHTALQCPIIRGKSPRTPNRIRSFMNDGYKTLTLASRLSSGRSISMSPTSAKRVLSSSVKCCHLLEMEWHPIHWITKILSDLRTFELLQETKNIASCTKQQEFEFHKYVFLSATSQKNIFNATEMHFAFSVIQLIM